MESSLNTAAAAKSLQSCPTLCDSIDGSPPGFPVPGILQARTLEWGATACMKGKSEREVAQSSPTLSNPMDCSLPGSSIHGIFQARVLEWGAIAFSVSSRSQIKTQHLAILYFSTQILNIRISQIFFSNFYILNA